MALFLNPTPTYSSPSFICDPPRARGPNTPSQGATLQVHAETDRSFWFCVSSIESCTMLPMLSWLVLLTGLYSG